MIQNISSLPREIFNQVQSTAQKDDLLACSFIGGSLPGFGIVPSAFGAAYSAVRTIEGIAKVAIRSLLIMCTQENVYNYTKLDEGQNQIVDYFLASIALSMGFCTLGMSNYIAVSLAFKDWTLIPNAVASVPKTTFKMVGSLFSATKKDDFLTSTELKSIGICTKNIRGFGQIETSNIEESLRNLTTLGKTVQKIHSRQLPNGEKLEIFLDQKERTLIQLLEKNPQNKARGY